MWAAIRYRRAQAAVLVLLSALVAACAAFAPLYQRALGQALLSTHVGAASPADTALVVRAGRGPANPSFGSAALAGNVPARVAALYGRPVGAMSDGIAIRPAPRLKASPGELVSRDQVCEHLRITIGACPAGKDEILVSAKDLAAWHWRIGQVLSTPVSGTGTTQPLLRRDLTIVGAYEVVPDAAYWLRTQLDGKSGSLLTIGTEQVPALDDFVTAEATFDRDWRQAQATLTYPLRRQLVTLDSLDDIGALLGHPSPAPSHGVDGALVETSLPSLIDDVRLGQRQLGVIVPLLMAQLGLLAGAILLIVTQAAVEQRRPEVALARLRGRSKVGAARLVMAELGLTMLIGLPVGFGAALGLAWLVRAVLLPAGVPFEVPWPCLAALGAAAAVCAAAIWVAARPVQRMTVTALLRRVDRERGRAVGAVDLLALALAAVGLVGLASGTVRGPIALVTPTLVSLAAGLVAARLAVPLAAAAGRANLRRGRVGPALTAFGLERRPVLRKVVTTVSVAVALTVFAANAVVVGERNWQARARVQTGAPAVLDTDSRNPAALLAAVRHVDPSGELASPVAVVRRTDAASTPTLAVVTRDFGAVAFEPPGGAYRLGPLAPPDVEPVHLAGMKVTGRLSWDLRVPAGESVQLPPGQSGQPRAPSTDPGGTPSELRISVTTPDGQRLTRLLAQIPLEGKGSMNLDAPLLCPGGCRLDGLEFRKTADLVSRVSGRLTISGLGVDGRSLRLAAPQQWNDVVPSATSTQDRFHQLPSTGDTMSLDVVNTGFSLMLSHADVPAVLPGVLAGPVPTGGTAGGFDAVGLNGAPLTVSAGQTVPTLPVVGRQGVLVDYETLARLGGTLPDRGRLSVWVARPSQAAQVAAALSGQGVGVLARHTEADAASRLNESASARGLRLAVFTGAMGILLAALVVIVMTVTGWRVVARDMAALQMSGVPLPVLRGALVREQVAPVVLGAAVGLLCGAVSSVLAMPLVPLFDSAADPVPPLELAPAWGALLAVAVAATVTLALVAWLSASGAGRRISLRRIRDAV